MSESPAPRGSARRTTFAIGLGAGLASFSMNFWWPFLPLYLRTLGVDSDARAVFWVGIAVTVQGVARLVSGPFWGVLADRYGRKIMFVRALYAATFTTIVAAVAQHPLHIVAALTLQGLLSGFNPAAIALTTVSVPDSQINRSLATVTGGQYLGTTLGPATGAILASAFGYRAAIVTAALLPSVAATWVLFAVARDHVAPRAQAHVARTRGGIANARHTLGEFGAGFWIAVFVYFALFALNQLVRIPTPVALKEITTESRAASLSGLTFSLGGAASVVGVLVVARIAASRWRVRRVLVTFALLSAAVHPLLAAGNVWVFMTGFALVALLSGASIPSSNTLIATQVPVRLRGTAFGIASSAQAIAFMAGPMAAAYFTAHSLRVGFLVTGFCFLLVAGVIFVGVRDRRAVGP